MNFFRIGASVIGAILIVGLIVAMMVTVRIPNGYVGIVYSPNGGVKDANLGQGWQVTGLFDKVTKYPVRMQTKEYKEIQIATSDGKNITIDFAFNYQIEPDKVSYIFNTFGPIPVSEIEDTYLRTRFWDAARKSISKFTVIDVYGEKSSEAAIEVQKQFSEDVAKLGFIVSNVTVGVPKPDAKTQEAIDKRVEAAQELERKNTELEIAKKEAQRKREEAKGVADSAIEKARGESESNRLIQQSINSNIITWEFVKNIKDVQFPKVWGSDSGILQLPKEFLE
ncbi:prohibitin family protein [Paenibacillaceae bacterium]|nr:prohibitin family protein [Paenibacillaceae bacterium]